MANPNFNPTYSTNDIFRDLDAARCLTDDLDTIEANITGKAAANHTHSYNDLNDKPTIPTIPASLPANGGNADTVDGKHANEFAASTHTHDYAATNHTHPLSAITGILDVLMTGTSGGVRHSYTTGDMLSIMNDWETGVHTAYFMGGASGCTNLPKTGESWRVLCHKTSGTIGWVLAFGSSGSIYSNYIDSDNWRGWKVIYDANPVPLWSGEMYMVGTHTIIPTKPLSDCRNGWILLWSDYNVGEGVNNSDFVATVIPKRAYTGQLWNGAQWLCAIPRYADSTGEEMIVKALNIYDTKIVGNDINSVAPRNDVVLRTVYEF